MDTARHSATRELPDREILLLAVVDILSITAFVFAGLVSHDINPIAEPIASVATVAPFVIGWLVVAPLAGVYGGRTTSVGHTARVTTIAWIAAANIGLILRSSPLFEGGAVWPFNLIMTGLGLLVLVGWRVGYVAITSD